jgi:hypothetical protein
MRHKKRSIPMLAWRSLVLGAVPALALIEFGPAAWSAARTGATALHRTMPARAAARLDHGAAAELLAWHDTDAPAVVLVAQAHRISATNNNEVRRLRSLLQTQTPGTLDYALTTQTLLLAAAERDAWDLNWRKMGRRGADLHVLSESLLNLRIEFSAANTWLQSLQTQERAASSPFSLTPPLF